MNAEQLATFDHNVYVENENTEMLINATNENMYAINNISEYLKNLNDFWFVFEILLALCLYYIACWMEKLQLRIEQLEEDRPEKHPLLATF